jgi:hypothetical protein
MIGPVERGSLLPSLVQAASYLTWHRSRGQYSLVWDELIHESVVEIETCTTSMHPSSIFQSSVFRLQRIRIQE